MAMRGRDVDEVKSQRSLGGGYGYGGPELRRLIQELLLVSPRVLLEPESRVSRGTIQCRCSSSPKVNQRFNLWLGFPPVLRRRVRTLVGQPCELKLLPCQLEVLAGDLRTRGTLSCWSATRRQDGGIILGPQRAGTHVNLVRLDFIPRTRAGGVFNGLGHDRVTLHKDGHKKLMV